MDGSGIRYERIFPLERKFDPYMGGGYRWSRSDEIFFPLNFEVIQCGVSSNKLKIIENLSKNRKKKFNRKTPYLHFFISCDV